MQIPSGAQLRLNGEGRDVKSDVMEIECFMNGTAADVARRVVVERVEVWRGLGEGGYLFWGKERGTIRFVLCKALCYG